MKSKAYFKHEIKAISVYSMMMFLMVVTRPFMTLSKWMRLEDIVFNWLEKDHVEI